MAEAERSPSRALGGATLPTLRRLRVASLDRLLREVSRVQPDSTRASVLADLDSAGNRVSWLDALSCA
jgi:hypothetical protein